MQQLYKTQVKESIEKSIKRVFDITAFKRNVPLCKIIIQEIKEEDRLQKSVTVIDDMVQEIKKHYPFINLEGLTLDWTTEEIIKQICDMIEQVPTISFSGKKPDKKDNTEAILKIEKIFREVAGVNDDEKIKSDDEVHFKKDNLTYSLKKKLEESLRKMLIEELPEGNWESWKFKANQWTMLSKLKNRYKGQNKL